MHSNINKHNITQILQLDIVNKNYLLFYLLFAVILIFHQSNNCKNLNIV